MSDKTLGVDPTKLDSVAQFDLGDRVRVDDKEYIYCSAAAIEAVNEAVVIDEDYAIVSLTTTSAGAVPTRVGVLPVATTAATYVWVQILGSCTVLGAASCAKDVVLNTTATAGVLDDASTTVVAGIRLDETLTGAAAAAATMVTYPTCN